MKPIEIKYYVCLLLAFPGSWEYSFAGKVVTDALKNILITAETDSLTVDSLYSLAHHYRETHIDSTLHYARLAHQLAEKSRDTSLMMGLSMKLMRTAIDLRRNRKFLEAEKLIFISIRLREMAGEEYNLIGPYVNLTTVYYNLRKYGEGISAAIKAKEIAIKYLTSPDTDKKEAAVVGIGNSYYNIGRIYFEKGEYEMAIENYSESVHYRNISGNKRRKAQSLMGMADIYVLQNNYVKALKYYNAALTLYEEIGFSTGIATASRNLGNVFDFQQNYGQALAYYNNSLNLQIEKGLILNQHLTYQMLGSLYHKISLLQNGEIIEIMPRYRPYSAQRASRILSDSANYYLSLAFDLSKQSEDQLIMLRSLLGLADISSSQKNFNKALSQLSEAVSYARNIGAKAELIDGYLKLSVVSEMLGRHEDALEFYKVYSATRDSVFNENSAKQIVEIQAKYETEKKNSEIELLSMNKEIQDEQLARQKVQRDGIFIIMAFLVLTGILLFRSQHLRKKLEKQTAIIQERKRISADLHDDVGSGLSRIILLSEMVKKIAKTQETRNEVAKIASISLELSSNISEIIWALNSNNDYLENLVAYIRRYAAEYFENAALRLKISTPGHIAHIPINGEKRRNIFYAVKEGLHNIIKHADATEAELRFELVDNVLLIVIKDNGKGLPLQDLNRFGNGLSNMQARISEIKGSFNIENHAGTMITISLPI
jgi:signal transduction histidine kinase